MVVVISLKKCYELRGGGERKSAIVVKRRNFSKTDPPINFVKIIVKRLH